MESNFTAVHKGIEERYSDLFDSVCVSTEYIALDILESLEDATNMLPLLAGLADRTYTDEEAKTALFKIQARAWHLSEHLLRLADAIEE